MKLLLFVDLRQPLSCCFTCLCIIRVYSFVTLRLAIGFFKLLWTPVLLGQVLILNVLLLTWEQKYARVQLCFAFRYVVSRTCTVYSWNLNGWHCSVRPFGNCRGFELGYGIALHRLHLKQFFMIVLVIFLSGGIQHFFYMWHSDGDFLVKGFLMWCVRNFLTWQWTFW